MEEKINLGKEVLFNTYSRFPIVFDKGEGVYLFDENGKKYLDFVAGIAVNSLGYNDKGLNEALKEQMKKLFHVSNLYYTSSNIKAAEILVNNSKHDKIFFCNSGAEAIEGAIKLARMHSIKFGEGKQKVIAMENSFHGRTFGALSATGQHKYQKNVGPLLPEIIHVPFNDYDKILENIEDTCAILLEPIQGEGGIRPANIKYLEKVRKLCDEKNILLIFDEVQCGVGRTGKLFAYDYFNVIPDIVCMAKGIAAGFPLGAVMASKEVAKAFEPGNHASTFGGNALGSAACYYTINKIVNENILLNVQEVGAYLREKLEELRKEFSFIKEVRGVGLMLGIELDFPVKDVILSSMDKGLLLVNSGENIIRFVPPLIISKKEIDEAINIIRDVLKNTKSYS